MLRRANTMFVSLTRSGMLASFAACGVASSFVSLMIMPRTISSCGASGAIFGLYSVCVLGKVRHTAVYGEPAHR